MKQQLYVAVACVSILPLLQPASASNWIIDANRSVGPIVKESSENGLTKMLGSDNVRHSEIYIGEGMTEPGTVLFPNDSTKTVDILWRDKDQRTSPVSIIIRNEGTVWKTKEGITIGTSLKVIERLNGRPFELAGFGWDYSGTIVHGNGGRIREFGVDRGTLGIQGRSLIVRLLPKHRSDVSPEYEKQYGRVMGDKSFWSSDPAMQLLDPQVYQIIIDWQ
jgi:hypothetical protein